MFRHLDLESIQYEDRVYRESMRIRVGIHSSMNENL